MPIPFIKWDIFPDAWAVFDAFALDTVRTPFSWLKMNDTFPSNEREGKFFGEFTPPP
jgi:hypothetical protein